MRTKLSTLQLTLLSTGGIIGAGWLFSPFYGFQTAGVGVIASWIITAVITSIIAISFAEVASILPIVGGISRFIGVTHNRTMAFIFLGLSWISYVVYLPIEAQSAVQYLGFFWSPLVVTHANQVSLSMLGLGLAFFIIVGLTWFNCLVISRVAKVNSWVSIWKLLVPFGLAILFICLFGKWDNIVINYHNAPLSFENILLAVTSSGLAFAFAGFQNGLALANSARKPEKALPYSLFMPIILGGIIYLSLSLTFIACIPNPNKIPGSAVAPLLGLVALFGIQSVYLVLFVDAVIAPLGTANVFTATTSRVLYGLAKDFMPNSILMRLNKNSAPYICLWISGIVGMGFLLPFPTWKELVNFLSSVTVFAYLAGPIALIILRQDFPETKRSFRTRYVNLVGYAGFACCSLLIYWSEFMNLFLLTILLLLVVISYALISKTTNLVNSFKDSWAIIFYLVTLTLISYLRSKKLIPFPADNLLVIASSLIFCYILVKNKLSKTIIAKNLDTLNLEIEQHAKH
jgi:amino acid transporter